MATQKAGENCSGHTGNNKKIQAVPQKLVYGTPEKRMEYTVSMQHNGYEMEGHVLKRTYFDNQVGSIGQSFYTDGQWHTTANIPQGIKIMQFPDEATALEVAREDASRKGLPQLVQSPKTKEFVISSQEQPITIHQPISKNASVIKSFFASK